MIEILTIVHVVISLIAICSGLVVMFGLLNSKRLDRWTAIFLITTVATSATGFLFPFHGFTPGIVVGLISFGLLALAIIALYAFRLAGAWRLLYVVTALLALYLNVFVLIAQLFQKVPSLKALAPSQSEPPFLFTQLIVLVAFVFFIVAAAIKFHIEPTRTTVRGA